MGDRVEQVKRWRTIDGREHSSESLASRWADRIDLAQRANEMLESGESLLAVLDHMGSAPREDNDRALLAGLTGESLLVISHWQCNDEPAYRVRYVNPSGSVFCGGRGGWMGYYGNDVSISDLVRYAAKTAEWAKRSEARHA